MRGPEASASPDLRDRSLETARVGWPSLAKNPQRFAAVKPLVSPRPKDPSEGWPLSKRVVLEVPGRASASLSLGGCMALRFSGRGFDGTHAVA
jgi:hypothetical protein